eukprot:1568189-Amphidinium_carterae.1
MLGPQRLKRGLSWARRINELLADRKRTLILVVGLYIHRCWSELSDAPMERSEPITCIAAPKDSGKTANGFVHKSDLVWMVQFGNQKAARHKQPYCGRVRQGGHLLYHAVAQNPCVVVLS